MTSYLSLTFVCDNIHSHREESKLNDSCTNWG
jgi:hypothetical protein